MIIFSQFNIWGGKRRGGGGVMRYVGLSDVWVKAVPLQARTDPEGSRKLGLPDYMTTAQDGGKVVSLTHWPPLPPRHIPGTHFC